MYKLLRGCFFGLGLTIAIVVTLCFFTQWAFILLLLPVILAMFGVGVALAAQHGAFLSNKWFRENGIRTEAMFEKIEADRTVTYSGSDFSSYPSYTIHVTGINPVTGQQQTFTQSCLRKEIGRFTRGDKLTVYVHPKRPEIAYRIDGVSRHS